MPPVIHKPTFTFIPANGPRGPRVQTMVTCACGWEGAPGVDEGAQHQYAEHVRDQHQP